jgi:hypothetical protein
MITPRLAIPSTWADRLTTGPLSLGYDVATTQKKTSNPSALAVMQTEGRLTHTRLLVSWKTREPIVAEQLLSAVLEDIEARRLKPRRLIIDASSERYYAAAIRTRFGGRCPVELIAGQDKLEFRGERLDAKTLLGNLYVSALEDAHITLPAGEWIEADHRLVMREAGGFTTLLGPNGEHGDTFDACKLAYYGLNATSAPLTASSILTLQVGTIATPGTADPQLRYTDPWMDGIVNRSTQTNYLA